MMLMRPLAFRLPLSPGAQHAAPSMLAHSLKRSTPALRVMTTTTASTAGRRSSRFSSSFKWGMLGFGASAITLAALNNNVFGEEAKSSAPTLIPAAPPTEEEMAKLMEDDNESSKPHSMFGKVGLLLYNYLIEPLLVFRRFIVLALLFGPVILSIPLLFLGPSVTTKTSSGEIIHGERQGALWWYSFLVAQMGRAGPTFVKLGQWAGSRRDLFPDALCDRFAKLHSNNDPHAFRYTKKVLEHAFQKPFDEIFESFEHKPVGVGAVGQVYKAVVRSELLPASYFEAKHQQESHMPEAAQRIGEELALMYEHDEARRPTAAVAIKVLHPKVRRTIRHDIRIMRFFANLINTLPGMEWVSLPEEVQQFSTLMFSQLDLRHEANNLARFERNFVKRNSAISFPRPLLEFCSKDVLVEELIEAVPLKHFLEMGGLDYDERIADLGLDAFLTILSNLLSRCLASFDPDYRLSANYKTGIIPDRMIVQELLAKKNDKHAWHKQLQEMEDEGYQAELVFLDAGLISELSTENLRNFMDLFAAIASFDGSLAGKLMVERCRSPQLVTNKKGFEQTMDRIVSGVKDNTFNLANLQIGDVLSETLKAVRQYHVKMEPDFVDTVLSILILEGIGRRLDPDLDVSGNVFIQLFKSAIPILRKLGHRMSGDESQLDTLRKHADWKSVVPMIKLWFYVETRAMLMGLTNSPERVDAFMRYGWLSE